MYLYSHTYTCTYYAHTRSHLHSLNTHYAHNTHYIHSLTFTLITQTTYTHSPLYSLHTLHKFTHLHTHYTHYIHSLTFTLITHTTYTHSPLYSLHTQRTLRILNLSTYWCSSGTDGQSRAWAGSCGLLPVVVRLAGLRRITCIWSIISLLTALL